MSARKVVQYLTDIYVLVQTCKDINSSQYYRHEFLEDIIEVLTVLDKSNEAISYLYSTQTILFSNMKTVRYCKIDMCIVCW